MKRTATNMFEFIKYLLFFILAILSIYLILLVQGLVTRPYPPKNSIEVSPISDNIKTTEIFDIIDFKYYC